MTYNDIKELYEQGKVKLEKLDTGRFTERRIMDKKRVTKEEYESGWKEGNYYAQSITGKGMFYYKDLGDRYIKVPKIFYSAVIGENRYRINKKDYNRLLKIKMV